LLVLGFGCGFNLQVLKPRKLGFTACVNLNFLGFNAVAKNKALRHCIKFKITNFSKNLSLKILVYCTTEYRQLNSNLPWYFFIFSKKIRMLVKFSAGLHKGTIRIFGKQKWKKKQKAVFFKKKNIYLFYLLFRMNPISRTIIIIRRLSHFIEKSNVNKMKNNKMKTLIKSSQQLR
jgi:hypothetical protein